MDENPPRSKSWSIHTRTEITSKYKILNHIGAGAYSDVYRAIRISDDLTVALKEIHDYQSAYREIEALQTLSNCPNIVTLIEWFWSEDEDCVLVLEFLGSDLGKIVRMGVREGGLDVEEIKGWMVQILRGVDQCHRGNVVHRDLKLENLLVSEFGVLKIADFGQARIFIEHGLVEVDDNQHSEQNISKDTSMTQPPELIHEEEDSRNPEPKSNSGDDYLRKIYDETDKEAHFNDGDTSCLATCTTSDREDDPSYSLTPEHIGGYGNHGPLTSCVGTRWFRAPELLYGSINYGPEIDLWSLGCIFAELLSLKPIFPGTSDIDQLSKIINVLGNLNEENWPGCVNLPDYGIISFSKVVNPVGIEACLPDRSSDEILLVKKLLCYDPEGRATAMELLNDKYFSEEPFPAPLSELRVPSTNSGEDVDSLGDARDIGSDSDFEDFSRANVETTDSGFSIHFP